MKRTITIDGKEITFKASAKTPLLYRQLIGNDLFTDMNRVQEDQSNALEVFGNLAYVMAKQADPSVGDIDEWFDQFGMFSVYTALPQLTDLWGVEMTSTSVPKKKANKRKGS